MGSDLLKVLLLTGREREILGVIAIERDKEEWRSHGKLCGNYVMPFSLVL